MKELLAYGEGPESCSTCGTFRYDPCFVIWKMALASVWSLEAGARRILKISMVIDPVLWSSTVQPRSLAHRLCAVPSILTLLQRPRVQLFCRFEPLADILFVHRTLILIVCCPGIATKRVIQEAEVVCPPSVIREARGGQDDFFCGLTRKLLSSAEARIEHTAVSLCSWLSKEGTT